MERVFRGVRPLLFLILINLIGMSLIMMKEQFFDKNMMFLCGMLCVIGIVVYLIITLAKLGDPYLFIITLMLASIGVIMQVRLDSSDGIRQMKLLILGIACFWLTFIMYLLFRKWLHKLMWVYYGAAVLMLVAVMIFGEEKYGAKNWIDIFGISFQPSEMVRILLVMALASAFTNAPSKKIVSFLPEKFRTECMARIIISGIIAYTNMFILVLSREWGIALLFFAIYFSFVFIYSESKLYLFLNILAAGGAGFIGVKFMSHIQRRVAIWKDPFADPLDAGYQICQSLYAVASGGFSGRGIGNVSERVVACIPIVESDFIFSLICEEMGVLGGLAVLMLYFVLVYRGFKISLSCTNVYNKAVSMGLSVMLGVQTFIIVGGVTKLIPLTGITLPFISAGGSSMLTTFIALGILQAVSAAKGEVTDEIE